MSRVAQDWAAGSEVRGDKRLILWELADCHNATTGRCDPSVRKNREKPTGKSLSERTGLGETKVGRLLAELEKDNVLIRHRRHWKDGGHRASDQYHLAIDGIEKLRKDIDAEAFFRDERMTTKAHTGAPRSRESKAQNPTEPRRSFEQDLGAYGGGAYQEEGTGKEETGSGSSYVPDSLNGTGAANVPPSEVERGKEADQPLPAHASGSETPNANSCGVGSEGSDFADLLADVLGLDAKTLRWSRDLFGSWRQASHYALACKRGGGGKVARAKASKASTTVYSLLYSDREKSAAPIEVVAA